MTANAILMLSGALCIYLSGQLMYSMKERQGKPAIRWTASFLGASSIAMSVIILLIGGLTLVAKGLFTI